MSIGNVLLLLPVSFVVFVTAFGMWRLSGKLIRNRRMLRELQINYYEVAYALECERNDDWWV